MLNHKRIKVSFQLKMKVEILEGQTLWEALAQLNIVIDRPCAGNGRCGACAVFVEGVGNVASCRFKEPGIYQVEIPEQEKYSVLVQSSTYEKKSDEILGRNEVVSSTENNLANTKNNKGNKIAIDLGTTTVAMKIFKDGGVVSLGFINPQRSYGSDVTSRIKAAQEGKAEILQTQIISAINQQISKYSQTIDEIVISANTTMQHLLRGLNVRGLAKAPFSPEDLSYRNLKIKNLSGKVVMLPGISAYVGADIVSGLYHLKILDNQSKKLFIDLGTNGEMALYDGEKITVTSTAAGPAFEASTLALKVHAAGVIKTLAYLKGQNIIDEYGTLSDDYFESGYPVTSEICQTNQDEPINFTQDNIRDIQMAKAAIRAGIEIMLSKANIDLEEIDTIYLAGGMGYYIDIEDAIEIGILPNIEEKFNIVEKTIAVGNTSIEGACDYIKDPKAAKNYMEEIIRKSTEITLANENNFEELYINYMNF